MSEGEISIQKHPSGEKVRQEPTPFDRVINALRKRQAEIQTGKPLTFKELREPLEKILAILAVVEEPIGTNDAWRFAGYNPDYTVDQRQSVMPANTRLSHILDDRRLTESEEGFQGPYMLTDSAREKLAQIVDLESVKAHIAEQLERPQQ